MWLASFGLFWISWKTLFFSRFECNAGGSKTFTKVYQKELQQTVWKFTNFIYHPEYWSTWVIFCFPSVLHFLSVQSFILINSNSLFIKLIFKIEKWFCLLNFICITSRDIHNQASKVIRPSSQFVKHCKIARWRPVTIEFCVTGPFFTKFKDVKACNRY